MAHLRIVLAVLLALLILPAAQAESPWLAVVGGTVIDGSGQPPRPHTTILIDGERIVAIGADDTIDLPFGTRIVDATKKWVIPGLIDAHVHFFQSGGLYTRPDLIDLRAVAPYKEEIEQVRAQLPETFARYIASGVTSVIDGGGPFWIFDVRSLAERIPRAPRVAATGPLLSNAPPAQLQELDDPPMLAVTTAESAREAVDRLLPYKPDMIKIWLTPGGRPLDEELAWVRAATAAARAAGIRVLANSDNLALTHAVVAAGASVVAHTINDLPVDSVLLNAMQQNNVVSITTLAVEEVYQEVFNGQLNLRGIERRLGNPAALASLIRPSMLPLDGLGPDGGLPALPPVPNGTAADNLLRVHEQGIAVAAGSDAGNIGMLHGPALHRELERMVAAGLTPMQALLAATRGGAIAMQRQNELGSLNVGKMADLVVLDDDPLRDISNTQKIRHVIKNGLLFNPEEIARELRMDRNSG